MSELVRVSNTKLIPGPNPIFGSGIESIEAEAIAAARRAEELFKSLGVKAKELDEATLGLRGTQVEAAVTYGFFDYGDQTPNYMHMGPNADRMRVSGKFAGIVVLKESMVDQWTLQGSGIDLPVVCAEIDHPTSVLEGDRLKFNDNVPCSSYRAWLPLREVSL